MNTDHHGSIEFTKDAASDTMRFVGALHAGLLNASIMETIRDVIVHRVAERFVEENYAALAAHMNPQAIANLAVAAAGAALNRTMQERLPGPGPVQVKVDARTTHDHHPRRWW